MSCPPLVLGVVLLGAFVMLGGCSARAPMDRGPADAAVVPAADAADAADGDAEGPREDGGGDLGGDVGQGDAGPGPEQRFRVGPAGGVVGADGVWVEIPAGALNEEVELQIGAAQGEVPAGFEAYSLVYLLGPQDVVFARPVVVRAAFLGDAPRASAFVALGQDEGEGWRRVGGEVQDGELRYETQRLSPVFVASARRYQNPANPACTRTRVWGRQLATEAGEAGVALLAGAEDCQGRALWGLGASDFVLREDPLPALEASLWGDVASPRSHHAFVQLVLEMGEATEAARPAMVEAVRQFLGRLAEAEGAAGLHVGISLYDGAAVPAAMLSGELPGPGTLGDEPGFWEWQAPSLDFALVEARLGELLTYRAAEPATRNLHGAILAAGRLLDHRREAFGLRQMGGALTSGHLVVLSAGADTAMQHATEEVREDVRARGHSLSLVPLDMAAGEGRATLQTLASALGQPFVPFVPGPTYLVRELGAVANDVASRLDTSVVMGFCSGLRAAQGRLELAYRGQGGAHEPWRQDVDGSGFGPGCTREGWRQGCAERECGGLACGACDAREAHCEGPQGRCRSYCEAQPEGRDAICGGERLHNPAGYAQICADRPHATQCEGQCRDVQTDREHCGQCGQRCEAGQMCLQGSCRPLFREVLVPAGQFVQGPDPGDPQGEARLVTITRAFWMQATEVTQRQWQEVMGTNLAYHPECGPDCPVEQVSWWQALAFANALSGREGLPACYRLTGCAPETGVACAGVAFEGLDCTGYRLATEAEWEYAARAGEEGALMVALEEVAWCASNSNGQGQPVATRQSNAWGLHDMLGNVWEWTWDWYAPYGTQAVVDPTGPAWPPFGALRVYRGGSWRNGEAMCSASYRRSSVAGGRYINMGVRLVRTAP